MQPEINNPTVILLINNEIEEKNNFVRKWFEKSRFQTIEAENIFQAIEDNHDFTTSQRPQIILLKVHSLTDDFQQVRRITQYFSDGKEISIMALSGSHKIINHRDCFEGTLSEIKLKLDELIPKNTQMAFAV